MKNVKTFIAYLLVAIFLLGSIAASAQTTTIKPIRQTVKGGGELPVCSTTAAQK